MSELKCCLAPIRRAASPWVPSQGFIIWHGVAVPGCRVQVPSPPQEGWERSKGREQWGWRVLPFIHFINMGCSQAGIFSFPLYASLTKLEILLKWQRWIYLPTNTPQIRAPLVLELAPHLLFVACENCLAKGSILGTALKGIWSLFHQWGKTACLLAAGSLSVLMEYCI